MTCSSNRALLTCALVALLAILAGCSSRAAEGVDFEAIDCHAAYRASAGEVLDESPTLSLSSGGDAQSTEFGAMTLHAQFVSDAFEGQSLSIWVTTQDTGEELVRELYQLDPQSGLSNQFVGGHGFTGLIYAFDPSSGAELQYYCEVR